MVLSAKNINAKPLHAVIDNKVAHASSSKDDKVVFAPANDYFIRKVNMAVKEADSRLQERQETRDDDPFGHGNNTSPYPVVDISSWMAPASNDPHLLLERARVVDQVTEQVTTAGSFNIKGHGLSQQLLEELENSARAFFEQPVDVKKKFINPLGDKKIGYSAIQSESSENVYKRDGKPEERMDLREVYSTIYPPTCKMNQAVLHPQKQKELMDQYLEHMTRIDECLHVILTAVIKKLKPGVDIPDDHLQQAKGGATGLLRVSRYPKMTDSKYDKANKIKAHSDWGPLTILYSQESGLEEIRDGEWTKVPIGKGELHVNIGDPICVWSNLAFQNNIHRVSPDAAADRISFAYFAASGEIPNKDLPGIEPVCEADEEAVFPGNLSAYQYVHRFVEAYFNQKQECT